MEKLEIDSKILGGKRAVTMYAPAGYMNTSKPRTFVLVFIRFYMTAGSWESAGALSANRILHSVLLGKGNAVDYREVANGQYYANVQQTLPDGLVALLGHESRR
jgi:hypothetical protein